MLEAAYSCKVGSVLSPSCTAALLVYGNLACREAINVKSSVMVTSVT